MVPAPVYQATRIGKHEFVIDSRYTNLKPIGRGGYGIVASAVDNATGKPVAIKKISRDAFEHPGDFRRILREVKLLLHFRSHPNCLRVLDIMTTPADSLAFHTLYIVTELFESDLNKIILSGQKLSDLHAQFFLYQALRGLKYIHSAIVLHRDLKPANLLCNSDCRLAICDFNLGRGVDLAAQAKLTTCVRASRRFCSWAATCHDGAG